MLSAEKDVDWTGLKFSPDGKTILISTNGSLIRLIDAFTGATLQTFTGHLNSKSLPLEASFSPDSQGWDNSIDSLETSHRTCQKSCWEF